MTGEQVKLLHRMKELIKEGKCRFSSRKDRNYLQELLDIGINVNDAWKEILSLNKNYYFIDPKPSYSKKDENSLTFKKLINGNVVYIKIRLELRNNNEETVCLSFHIDFK